MGCDHGAPDTGNERVGHDEDHTHGSADRGDPGRRQGQAAEIRPPEGPASDLRQAGAVARPAGGARRQPTKIVVVVGHGADDVRDAVASWGLTPKPVFVEQETQLGTGHAVAAAEKAVGRSADVLVLGGDYDPLTADDVKALVRTHRRTKSAATMATAEVDDPGGYGRVDPRRRPARRDRGARRRDAGAACDPRGLAARDGLPAGGSVPDAPGRRRRQPPTGVLSQQRVPDPARQGGVRRRDHGRHRWSDGPQLSQRPRRRHARGPGTDQRDAHGEGRDPARPRHHVHRCRSHDRRGDDHRPQHDDRGRNDDRQGMPDRPERADRRLDDRQRRRRSGSRSSKARR